SFQIDPPVTPGWSQGGEIAWPTYEEHFFFLDYIRSKRDNFTFTHPKYGEIVGKINNVTPYHDDTDEYVSITFEFIEETTTEEVSQIIYLVPEMAAGFTDTNTKLTEVVEQAQKGASNGVAWIAGAQNFVADLDTYLSHLTSPATSLINTINYGTSLPGQIMGSINGAVDRIVQLYQTGRNAPASFINNCITGVRALKATFSGVNANYVHVMGSSRVAYEAGAILEEDDQNFRDIKEKEGETAFDAAGNYRPVTTLPETMTIDELEFALYEVRTLINEAIQIDRDNRALQEQARHLQRYVNRIKLDRDRIETKEYSLRTMHEIALDNGLTYHAAERIAKLNPAIINPTFTNGDIKVLIPMGV
ncbi:unnamed protein product, partial [marine sediment metagenome]